MVEKLGKFSWIVLVIFGLLQVSSGVQSLCILCKEPDHWDWLSRDPEILGYLNLVWRWLGVTIISHGVLAITISFTSFRTFKPWAWVVMWTWPAYFVAQAIVFPYTWPAMRILTMFSLVALLLPVRGFFRKHIEQSA